MTIQEWLKTHHACQRGQDFVAPLGDGNVWSETYRGDWHCWLLDSLLCPFGGASHERCLLVYPQAQNAWWVDFEGLRKKHKVGKNLQTYWALDNRHSWTRDDLIDVKGIQGGSVARLWIESAELIKAKYFELWMFGWERAGARAPYAARTPSMETSGQHTGRRTEG